jgi:hypothetical protein
VSLRSSTTHVDFGFRDLRPSRFHSLISPKMSYHRSDWLDAMCPRNWWLGWDLTSIASDYFRSTLCFLLYFHMNSMIWWCMSFQYRRSRWTSLLHASIVLHTPQRLFAEVIFLQSTWISATYPSGSNGPNSLHPSRLHEFFSCSTQISQSFISQALWYFSTYLSRWWMILIYFKTLEPRDFDESSLLAYKKG